MKKLIKKVQKKEAKIMVTDTECLRMARNVLKSKKWAPLVFKRGFGEISFSPEIDVDYKCADDWLLNILVVPDLNKPNHEHFFLNEEDLIQLHRYLGKLRTHIASLK